MSSSHWIVFTGCIGFFVASVLSALVLNIFATVKDGSRSALVLVWICWTLSSLVILLLPLDIANTVILRSAIENSPEYETSTLISVWLIRAYGFVYWGSYLLSWLVIPITTAYTVSGAFDFTTRAQNALRENTRTWILSLVALIAGCIYASIVHGFSFGTIRGLLISFGNSLGLLVVIMALGSGLVGFPSALLQFVNYEERLRYCEFRAAELMERLEDARGQLALAMGDVVRIGRKFDTGKVTVYNPAESLERLRYCYSIIANEMPVNDAGVDDAVVRFPQPAIDDVNSEDGSNGDQSSISLSEMDLADIRGNLQRKAIEFRKVSYLWREQCKLAFELQDLIEWKNNASAGGSGQATDDFRSQSSLSRARSTQYLNVYVLPVVCRILALFFAAVSALVIFAECTLWSVKIFQTPFNLSPFSFALHSSWLDSRFSIQLYCFAVVLFFAMCFLFAIFRFSFFNIYELVPQHTEPYTLLLNATLCVRYTFPLTYNVLTVLHETALDARLFYGKESMITAFSKVLRNIELVPVFGVNFNMYFPACLSIFVLLSFFDVWNRMLSFFGFKRFRMGSGGGGESLEVTGRYLLSIERNKWSRLKGGSSSPMLVPSLPGTRSVRRSCPAWARFDLQIWDTILNSESIDVHLYL